MPSNSSNAQPAFRQTYVHEKGGMISVDWNSTQIPSSSTLKGPKSTNKSWPEYTYGHAVKKISSKVWGVCTVFQAEQQTTEICVMHYGNIQQDNMWTDKNDLERTTQYSYLMWVTWNCGIQGNEMADQLVGRSSKSA